MMIEQQKQCLLVIVSDQKYYRLLQTYTNRINISRSVTFDEKEPNDGMKVIQEMTNPNNTEKETAYFHFTILMKIVKRNTSAYKRCR